LFRGVPQSKITKRLKGDKHVAENQKSRSRIKAFFCAVIFLFVIAVGIMLTGCGQQQQAGPPYRSKLDPIWQEASREDNSHYKMGVDCFQCHTVTDSQPQKKVKNEQCFGCHKQNYEGVASLTADLEPNPHLPPHYEDMDCSLCHKIHSKSEFMCAECHTFDYMDELSEDWEIK